MGKESDSEVTFELQENGGTKVTDISVGDSWSTKDGYPDFTEQDGRCFVLIRTEKGKEIMRTAEESKQVVSKILSIYNIQEMQPYQYQRRKDAGWRIIAVYLLTRGLLDFKGLDIIRQACKNNLKRGFSNMKGTAIRLIKTVWMKR